MSRRVWTVTGYSVLFAAVSGYTVERRMVRRRMNDKLERIWKERVVFYAKYSKNFTGGRGEVRNTLLSIIGIQMEIRRDHLPNESLER
jgi:hypothetical protein